MRKVLVFVLALAVLSAGVVAAGGQREAAPAPGSQAPAPAAPQSFTISVALHPVEFYRVGPQEMMDYITRESGGRITFETFQFPELGSEAEITEMVSIGEIEMATAMSDNGISQLMPSGQALTLPFLFPTLDTFVRLMDGPFFGVLQQQMFDESKRTVRVLSAMKSSVRHLYTTKGPIRLPADLVRLGIIMRVQPSPFHVALWEGLGTSTVTLPAAERYTGLQTGMIDGTEGGLMSAWQAGLMEVQKFTTLTAHAFGTGYIYINEEFFKSLPADLQKIVVDGAWVAARSDNQKIPVASIEALRLMRESGVTVTELTTAEAQEWRRLAVPIARQFLERDSGVSGAFVDRLLTAVAEIERSAR